MQIFCAPQWRDVFLASRDETSLIMSRWILTWCVMLLMCINLCGKDTWINNTLQQHWVLLYCSYAPYKVDEPCVVYFCHYCNNCSTTEPQLCLSFAVSQHLCTVQSPYIVMLLLLFMEAVTLLLNLSTIWCSLPTSDAGLESFLIIMSQYTDKSLTPWIYV